MAALTPVAALNDNGKGVADIDAVLVQAVDTTNSFPNDGNVMLFVSNGTVGAITVTLKSAPDAYGRGGSADANNDEVLSIPASKIGMYPVLNPGGWNAGGSATFVLSSAAAGVKIGVVRMSKLR